LAFVLVACSKAETPAVDTAAAAMTPAPVQLTASDVSGTGNGMPKNETNGSVTTHWTSDSVDDASGKPTIEGSKDAIRCTQTFDGDSVVVTSTAPYSSPAHPKGSMMNVRSVGRLKDGKLVDTLVNTRADEPDSEVTRGRREASRAP